tara:strand:- start:7 stop:456 length:450 start_codon:yes stop_codon:yes gene_type:complete
MKKQLIVKLIKEAVKEAKKKRPGLWANINAKKKRGAKASHGNSNAHKDAVAAGNSMKKENTSSKIECQKCSWSWEKKDGGKDPRTCHKCGHTNTLQALEGVHDPVKPGILKDRLGELSCTKVRKAKAGTKDKGSHFAKACQRYLNYHCQ